MGTLGLLVLVVFQADFQLTDGFVNSLDRLDAMSAEVVGSVLEMLLGIAQRLESFADLRMLFGRHWFDGETPSLLDRFTSLAR